MSDPAGQSPAPNPPIAPVSPKKQSHRFRRFFTAEVLIARESALGLAIALLALVIAAASMLQSRHANHTAEAANELSEENNRTNKKALAISEQLAAAKSKLTLNAVLSTKPEFTLTLKPIFPEFVLSDSQIEYMRLFSERVVNQAVSANKDSDNMIPSPFTEETEEAGVHSLGLFHYVLEEVISSARRKHKWRATMRYNYDEYDIAGFFPVIIRLDYAYEGRQARSVFLYEIFYSGWLNDGGKNGNGLDLGKPRLVRSLESNEDPTAILRERFQQWERENFTDHLVPEVATPMPTVSENKAKPKKRK